MHACSCVTVKGSVRPQTSVILFSENGSSFLPKASWFGLQHLIGQLNCDYNKEQSCLGMDQDIVL